jgi:hypothetical protein
LFEKVVFEKKAALPPVITAGEVAALVNSPKHAAQRERDSELGL